MNTGGSIAPLQWHVRGRVLDVSRPTVMGILNVTPDSFSDGGRHTAPEAAAARAEVMVAEGAAIIDVGGESTRPGSVRVSEDEELRRVILVIEAIASRLDVAISVDTMKAGVARAALAAGAHIVNDVQALQGPGMVEVAAQAGAGVVLMHMHGGLETMQDNPLDESTVVATVSKWLSKRVAAVTRAGIARERIAIDPGIGFGKTAAANEALIANMNALTRIGYPLVVGASRKKFIGIRTGCNVEDRLAGSIAAHVLAYAGGAAVIRCHDVRETCDALAVAEAIVWSH